MSPSGRGGSPSPTWDAAGGAGAQRISAAAAAGRRYVLISGALLFLALAALNLYSSSGGREGIAALVFCSGMAATFAFAGIYEMRQKRHADAALPRATSAVLVTIGCAGALLFAFILNARLA